MKIIIIVIACIIIGVFAYMILPNEPTTSAHPETGQVGHLTKIDGGEFWVYDGVPEGIKHSQPAKMWFEDIPDEEIPDGVYSFQDSDNECKNGEGQVKRVALFSMVCRDRRAVGCGMIREAYICGNDYVIYQLSSTYGPQYYGPYQL